MIFSESELDSINTDKVFSQEEKEILTEAHNERKQNASAGDIWCTTSSLMELKATNGFIICFEQWYDDGYAGELIGPYEINERGWGGDLQMG